MNPDYTKTYIDVPDGRCDYCGRASASGLLQKIKHPLLNCTTKACGKCCNDMHIRFDPGGKPC